MTAPERPADPTASSAGQTTRRSRPGPWPSPIALRSALRRVRWLALVAAMAWLAIYLAGVHTELGQRVENRALLGAALQTPAARVGSLEQLSTISQLSFAFAVLAVLAVALLRFRIGLGLVTVGVMGVAAVASQILKAVLPRPELLDVAVWMQRNTFPSGHATAATAVAVGAILIAPLRVRWLVVPIAAAYAALVGHATQIAGWHRLSDALGGVLLVLVVATVALAGLGRLGYVATSDHGWIHPRVLGALLAGAAAMLLIAATILALPLAFPLLYAPENARRVFLHVSLDLTGVGLTLLAITAFARIIEPLDPGAGASATSKRRGPAVSNAAPTSPRAPSGRPTSAPGRPSVEPGAIPGDADP